MDNNIQLPAKRVIEGEVVKDISAIAFTVKLDFSPEDLRDFVQAMMKAKQSTEEAQRRGVVRPVVDGKNLETALMGKQ